MSKKYPIISVAGSFCAGTTTVKSTFDQIFRREGISAATGKSETRHYAHDGGDPPRPRIQRRLNKIPMALITLCQLFDHAADHDDGLPAFNINNMEQGLGII